MCHCIAEWCALFSPARFSPCILLLYCCMISFGKWNIIVSLSNCRSLGPGFSCPQLSLPSITQQIRVPVRRENAQHHSAFGKMNTVKNHFQFQRRNQLEPCRDIPNGQQIGLSVSVFSIITVLLEPKVNWSELKLRDTSTRWAYLRRPLTYLKDRSEYSRVFNGGAIPSSWAKLPLAFGYSSSCSSPNRRHVILIKLTQFRLTCWDWDWERGIKKDWMNGWVGRW